MSIHLQVLLLVSSTNISGASKCRGMKTKINEGDGHGRDTDFFTSLQNLAKEIKSRGKRGESIKLKKALEEETREIAAKGEKKNRNPKATPSLHHQQVIRKPKEKQNTKLPAVNQQQRSQSHRQQRS